MNPKIVRMIAVTVAVACLGYGGSMVYRSINDDGYWDNLSTFCKLAVLLWVVLSSVLIGMWGRCYNGCKNSPFPNGCKSSCDVLWGGLLLIETGFLILACHLTHPQ